MVTTAEADDTAISSSWKAHFPEGDLWVFGYGSLIWKPPPHYDQRVAGYIEGYVRRFWQEGRIGLTLLYNSKGKVRGDHRGTPESPGRVLTVIERSFWETLSDPQSDLEPDSKNSVVWGAAYHIPASHAEEVHAYLDDREIDGYTVHYTPFYPSSTSNSTASTAAESASQSPMTCMVYIGLPSNSQFLRDPALRDPHSVAEVISRSRGQSGENRDYLFQLEEALEGVGLGYADGHVTELVDRVKKIEKAGGHHQSATAERGQHPASSTPDEFEHPSHR